MSTTPLHSQVCSAHMSMLGLSHLCPGTLHTSCRNDASAPIWQSHTWRDQRPKTLEISSNARACGEGKSCETWRPCAPTCMPHVHTAHFSSHFLSKGKEHGIIADLCPSSGRCATMPPPWTAQLCTKLHGSMRVFCCPCACLAHF
jgi:hypothetical protein